MAEPETFEATLSRFTAMKARRAAGATFAQLSSEFGVSRERARQIVSRPEPMPDGYRRTQEMGQTRRKHRLTAQIERWSNLPGAIAAAKTAAFREELARLEQEDADGDATEAPTG